MTQEEKDKLLKYLCMALPYGVKVQDETGCTYVLGLHNTYLNYMFDNNDTECGIKPYLRPMSSMTGEEINELRSLCEEDLTDFSKHIADGHGLSHDGLYMFPNIRQLNWLLEHHFDFMGLIPMDCAIEITEE